MAKDFTICIGTVGAGVWYSPNSGEKWRRSKMNLPFHAEPGKYRSAHSRSIRTIRNACLPVPKSVSTGVRIKERRGSS